MDIDKLFQVPKYAGGSKRKLQDNSMPTPEMLKKMKLNSAGISAFNSKESAVLSARRETVEDADVDPTFAPGEDADYFVEEDNEGRFFGGGLTSKQKEILNIFDKAGEGSDEIDLFSITRIRELLLGFERAVHKNQDQRSKYPDNPAKFIDSEADLDVAIKSLLPLSQGSFLSYPEIVRSGVISLIAGLLTHENMDIVIDVVELLYELTDEDADVDHESDQHQEAIKMFIEALVEISVLELLVENLARLNQEEESDREGIFQILGILENFMSLAPSLATRLVSKTSILQWLLRRIQAKDRDENRNYAAELLPILLQNSVDNKIALGKLNGVETLLEVISHYRRRDPVDADDTEFMDNLFDALCSALSESQIKKLFIEAEGPDLMILMIKGKLASKARCTKVLDYAMSGPDGAPVCQAFVEALGLKTIFTVFMGKMSKRSKVLASTSASRDISHSLGIISSLLSNLPTDSSHRIRLLAKFVEGDYEKIDKLVEIREAVRRRLKDTDVEIHREKQSVGDELDQADTTTTQESESALYLQRLEGGLFTLQTVDLILAWVIMEDDGIRSHALRVLDRNNQSLHDVINTLRLYEQHADDHQHEGSLSQRDILHSLISSLSNNGQE